MQISEVMTKMIGLSAGNTHDISHFQKVHSYARLIAAGEGLDEATTQTLEMAAILHDIACPLCRAKYGSSANGKRQEEEGMPLTREFFAGTDVDPAVVERVTFLVGHHHSPHLVDGVDYQILLEADYLVNAHEEPYSTQHIRNMRQKLFRTKTGTALLDAIYLRQE